MKIELILLGVIAAIFFIDFLVNLSKKKKINSEEIVLSKKTTLNKEKLPFNFSLDSILKRKKNISLFIIVVPFLKVLLHYFLYPIKIKRLTGKIPVPDRLIGISGGTHKNTYESIYAPLGPHFDEIFNKELWLFIPALFIPLIIIWFFNDKIKAR